MSDEPAPPAAPALEIAQLPLGPIATNCWIASPVGSSRAFIVDPGGDADRVLEHLRERGLEAEAILVTHCHWDHVGAVAELVAELDVPVYMSDAEAPALEEPERFAMPGMPDVPACTVDHRVSGGDRIAVAGVELEVLAVAGHSPGHVAYLVEGVADTGGDGHDVAPTCFIGDVVFQGSVGRTDLPFADGKELAETLRRLAARLHPDTLLLPGHGPHTTWGQELRSNPFVQGVGRAT